MMRVYFKSFHDKSRSVQERSETMDKKLRDIVNKILKLGGNKVLFIALFGSRAEGYFRRSSDYDIAVYYEGTKEERYKFLMSILGIINEEVDVKIFQDLPLVLKSKILSHGIMLYVRDYDLLFKVANKVRWEYEDFRHRLKLILGVK